MWIRAAVQIAVVIAVSFGCGGKDLPPSSSDAGDSSADSGIPDAESDTVPIACGQGELRCRDACFSAVKQKKHGCELIALGASAQSFSGLALGEETLFSVDEHFHPLAISTSDFAITSLSNTAQLIGSTLQYAQGWLYGNGESPSLGIFRISADGQTFEQIYPSQYLYHVQEEDLYLLSDGLADHGGVDLTAVAGGAEMRLVDGRVNSWVTAGDFYFYLRGFPQYAFYQSPRSSPLDESALGVNAINGNIFAWSRDQDHVYATGGGLWRIAIADGNVEQVSDEIALDFSSPGSKYVMFSRAQPNKNIGVYAVSYNGKEVLAVDPYDFDNQGMASDDAYFYLARGGGIFRIAHTAAKPAN